MGHFPGVSTWKERVLQTEKEGDCYRPESPHEIQAHQPRVCRHLTAALSLQDSDKGLFDPPGLCCFVTATGTRTVLYLK